MFKRKKKLQFFFTNNPGYLLFRVPNNFLYFIARSFKVQSFIRCLFKKNWNIKSLILKSECSWVKRIAFSVSVNAPLYYIFAAILVHFLRTDNNFLRIILVIMLQEGVISGYYSSSTMAGSGSHSKLIPMLSSERSTRAIIFPASLKISADSSSRNFVWFRQRRGNTS